jgi:hypothetical protein
MFFYTIDWDTDSTLTPTLGSIDYWGDDPLDCTISSLSVGYNNSISMVVWPPTAQVYFSPPSFLPLVMPRQLLGHPLTLITLQLSRMPRYLRAPV